MDKKLKLAFENMSSKAPEIKTESIRIIQRYGKDAIPELITILKQSDAYRQEIAIAILWEMFRQHGYTQ